MIVLKHLAREFNMDPAAIRKKLRKHNLNHTGRWQWHEDDQQLTKARSILSGTGSGETSSSTLTRTSPAQREQRPAPKKKSTSKRATTSRSPKEQS